MEKGSNNRNGIRLEWLNRGMIFVTVLLAIVLVTVAFSTNRAFKHLEQAMERYDQARTDTANMQAGSDYLTDRARTFVVTGDLQSAEDFYEEVEVTRRRDMAVDSMEKSMAGTDSARFLADALDASNHLAEIERYAMRLAAAGRGQDVSALPSFLQMVALSAGDESLSPEEQLIRAEDMLFDQTYQTYKSNIHESISLCEKALVGRTEAARDESARQLRRSITSQTVLIALVVLVVVIMVLYNALLVIHPIDAMVKAIQADKPVDEFGAQELRFVAHSYNSALLKSQQSQKDLAYKASHDALTGVYNRGMFEKAREKTRGRAQAMFIFDVDHFKQFNDEYGHDVGDRVLKKVAEALKSNFREEDYVCRFGGDEFTVLMVHVTSAMRSLVETKIRGIREQLTDTSDGLPPITLSIGVAFSDRPDPTDDILKDADTALYVTKENGRNGYTFYGDKQ